MTAAAESKGRQRRFLARRRKLLDIALRLAEDEGWEAVTTRRLAEAIDYSQPVIYQHFKNRDELIRTLVVEGFVTLTGRIDGVAGSARTAPLEDLCRTYIDFGTTQPRLYEAMFTRPTAVPFADIRTPSELREAFGALAAVIDREAPGVDVDATAELYWACCHGLVTLLNAERIPSERIEHHVRRVAEIVRLDNEN
ncbi:TetR/AcrR family transcriptional regulator [Brevibacterium ihuae]|uniref:TetR/AcrR family transcriptional regulator n=1 Tax=Brevibacterium ihuae TaxID=1631743 RepID=UPI000C765313|nr:TetR/AcrR family transcriptional regulator [Brevibacterium ihuae]